MSNTLVTADLEFGLRDAIPPGVRAAWGARLIFIPGDVNYVHNREDTVALTDADRDALLRWLNGANPSTGAIAPYRAAQMEASRLIAIGILAPHEFHRETLYHDDEGEIVGDPLGSHGYLYVSGYLR